MPARLRAFLVHLAISAAVLAVVLAFVLLVWFPAPYREFMGVGRPAILLVVLTLGLGPLLTLAVFRPAKKGLKFDLVVIAMLQSAALVWGVHQLYMRHPVYLVFAVDRFTVLVPGDFDPAEVVDGPFSSGLLSRPRMLVATLPADPGEREQLMVETLFQGKPDIDQRPRYWSLYSRDFADVLAVARPLAVLRQARPRSADLIDGFVARAGRPLESLLYHPLIAPRGDWVVILDPVDGAVLGALEVDSWFD